MADLISVEDFLEKILETVRPLNHFPQPLLESIGLPACEDVVSTISLPVFDNSAMDGYAVCHADVAGACDEDPVRLPVVGEIGAGQATLLAMSPGTAVKIMTGAPVPQGCDAVVPYEWTDRGVAQVVISQAPSLGQHIRPAGEDVQAGDLILAYGDLLGPRQIGLLAAVGHDRVSTRPRPRVVVISTGSELREPGTPLAHDSIYDANSYLIAAAARRAGAIVYRVGIVPDDAATFRDALADQLVRADLVVTSGG
jgi:molybdopterin molybdotransferase